MPLFKLTLQQTYFKQGFFNVVVDYDRYVRKTDGPVRLQLGKQGRVIEAKVNRGVNNNGTARILGGVPLREWFQSNFQPMDIVSVELSSEQLIVMEKA
jgi:hypothetical protein